MTSAKDIVDRAGSCGAKLTLAESCTGGLLAAALTEVPGASAAVDRGFVTYSNAAKEEMLGVGPDTLARHGAVSEEVAQEMAAGALARSHATLAIAITGVAGPGGSDRKPEGRVCFALAGPDEIQTLTVEFGPLGRAQVRARSVDQALDLLAAGLEALGP